jgi:hypothetical protein
MELITIDVEWLIHPLTRVVLTSPRGLNDCPLLRAVLP